MGGENETRSGVVPEALRFAVAEVAVALCSEVGEVAFAAGLVVGHNDLLVLLVGTGLTDHCRSRNDWVDWMSHSWVANHSHTHCHTERCTVRRIVRHVAPVHTRCS